jgi:hypothetical protein
MVFVTAPNGMVPNGMVIELPRHERMWTLAPTRFGVRPACPASPCESAAI